MTNSLFKPSNGAMPVLNNKISDLSFIGEGYPLRLEESRKRQYGIARRQMEAGQSSNSVSSAKCKEVVVSYEKGKGHESTAQNGQDRKQSETQGSNNHQEPVMAN